MLAVVLMLLQMWCGRGTESWQNLTTGVKRFLELLFRLSCVFVRLHDAIIVTFYRVFGPTV